MFYTAKLWFIKFKRLFKLRLQLFWLLLILCFVILYWKFKNCVNDEASDNPVILWWTPGFPGTSELKFCPDKIKCDIFSERNISKSKYVGAYLFYGSNINFNELPLPRKPDEIIWGLYHEESPRNVEELMNDELLHVFNYSSTLSRYSDIPFPLQHLESFQDITSRKYFVETTAKNSYLNEIAPIMYLQSDCETSTERDDYVKELMKFIKVDSYGSCLNNKKLPAKYTEDYLNHLNDDSFLKFIARYKFVLAIENGVCDDYVTEKFWRAIKVGTVPIYFGSPTIRDWFPNKKSALLLEDFPSPKILSQYITKLLNNNTLYEEYLDHKIEQIATNSRLIDEFRMRPQQIDSLNTVEEFECFVCKKLHEKKEHVLNEQIVSKSHYNCPKPISALTLDVNPKNDWVFSWELAMKRAEKAYKRIMLSN